MIRSMMIALPAFGAYRFAAGAGGGLLHLAGGQ